MVSNKGNFFRLVFENHFTDSSVGKSGTGKSGKVIIVHESFKLLNSKGVFEECLTLNSGIGDVAPEEIVDRGIGHSNLALFL